MSDFFEDTHPNITPHDHILALLHHSADLLRDAAAQSGNVTDDPEIVDLWAELQANVLPAYHQASGAFLELLRHQNCTPLFGEVA